jgi:antitoxin (DNA-binding transcriptional repressor) of toxin-antitoxin stability system
MTTITAKELRDNLASVVRRTTNGEHIRVTYREREVFEIRPIDTPTGRGKGMPGLEAFLAANKKPSPYDPKKSVKQLYHELLEAKYEK